MERTEKAIKALDYVFLVCIGLFVFTNSVWGETGTLRLTTYGVTIIMILAFLARTIIKRDVVFGPSVPLILVFLLANLLAWLFNLSGAALPRTPLLCSIMFLFVYLFVKNSDISLDKMLLSFFLGMFAFALVFIFHYRNELLHFSTEMRLGADFDNVNNVAYYLLYGSTVSLYLAYKNKRALFKILFYVAEMIFFVLLISTGSRSALLINMLLFFLELYFAFGKRKPGLFFGVVVGVVALGLVACFVIPAIGPLAQRFLNSLLALFGIETSEGSSAARILFPAQAFPIFLARPLFGWGRNYASNFILGNSFTHNNFVSLLVDSGIVGFISFEALIISPIVNSFRHRKRSDGDYHKYVLAILMALGIFLVQIFYVNSQQKTEFLILAFVNGAIERDMFKVKAEKVEGRFKILFSRAGCRSERIKI